MEIKEDLKTDAGIIFINDTRQGHEGQFRLIMFGEASLLYKKASDLMPQLEMRLQKATGMKTKEDLTKWLKESKYGNPNSPYKVLDDDSKVSVEINLRITEK